MEFNAIPHENTSHTDQPSFGSNKNDHFPDVYFLFNLKSAVAEQNTRMLRAHACMLAIVFGTTPPHDTGIDKYNHSVRVLTGLNTASFVVVRKAVKPYKLFNF